MTYAVLQISYNSFEILLVIAAINRIGNKLKMYKNGNQYVKEFYEANVNAPTHSMCMFARYIL